MTILITGAAGFIGFHVAKALCEKGEQVIGIDNLNDYYDIALKKARLKNLENENFKFYKADISEQKSIAEITKKHGGDISHVIHLAAQAGVRYSLDHPFSYASSNLSGQLIILEACRHLPALQHLVYASSSSVYGNSTDVPFSTESKADEPISLYAATKKSGELMAYSYSHLYNIPATSLRFFTVYGPWGRPDMAYFKFTRSIFDGMPIQVFGHGQMKRDFTYIDDIVSGILNALKNPPEKNGKSAPHQIYNLGNDRAENLMDFIATLEKNIGKEAIIEYQPMQPGDVRETHADITSARKRLDYNPKTTIAEGIPAFIRWYRDFYKV